MSVYPNGREWECFGGRHRYPEDFGPIRCPVDGTSLHRTLAMFTLSIPAATIKPRGSSDHAPDQATIATKAK